MRPLAFLLLLQDAPKTITTKTGVEMALIPAGAFVMGDEQGEKDERPAHKIEIGAFWMDRAEITQDQFEKMMGYNPAKIERKNYPVDQIRWTEAIEYCNARSTREGLTPCYDLKTGACNFDADGYRLPTEAEWEYACRAGAATRYPFGDDPSQLDGHAWYEKNSGKKAHPGGEKKPNRWGLLDMTGGLLEWCNDVYDPGAYAQSSAKDPTGLKTGKERVLRGGSFRMKAEQCRSASRFHDEPANADACFGWDTYGFRCVRRAR